MGRAAATKLYRTFTKGLITEAGYLTYPENASTDELNTVIKPKGSRSRRLGIDYEPSSTGSTIAGTSSSSTVSAFTWIAVGGDSNVNFLAVQVGSSIYFYDLSSRPISSGKKAFSVNLLDYKTSSSSVSNVTNTKVQMTSGKGWLFIAQNFIEPVLVEYNASTDTISATPIVLQIRDFDGVNDNLANDEQPTSLTKEHLYNLKNQGWFQAYAPVTTGGGGNLDSGQQVVWSPWNVSDKVYEPIE